MKIFRMTAVAALALASAVWAADPAPAPAADSLSRDVQDLSDQLEEAQGRIADLEKRLETVEQRLGDTFQPPTPFDTIERRLHDVEEDVDDLKRR